MKNKYKILALLLLFSSIGFAQNTLTNNDAASLALEQNYGIKLAKNFVEIAKNNASVYNSGYLPRISASAGAGYSNDSSENTSQDGSVSEKNNAESKSMNASIGLSYTLFDGQGRSYNYKKLKENYNLSELEAQAVIENSLLQVFSMYYEVARLTENTNILNESLIVSNNRLKRAEYSFEYGQNTKLQVLNAEVDVNNDSIRLLNSERLLTNAKRNLNLLIGRDVNIDFEVETNISFNSIYEYNTLLSLAKERNIEIQKAQKNIELSDFDIKINKSNYLPSLSFNSSYGFNKSDNDASFTYAEQLSKGLNAGLSLNWDIFDGGSTKTRVQNARINAENSKIQQEQISLELERDIANALETYNNAIFILNSETKNVETNQRNFERTEEQFKLAQVNSIEFRQAQINLLNAKSSLSTAKYAAKNAELSLLQLSGNLLNIEF